jgi:hypothetical protein
MTFLALVFLMLKVICALCIALFLLWLVISVFVEYFEAICGLALIGGVIVLAVFLVSFLGS